MKNRTLAALILLLLPLALLTISLTQTLAAPLSPYIMVTPEKTLNPSLTPGSSYVITLYTDYTGSDVWSWEFSLTFNPAVLEGASVANGDLITTAKHSSAVFTAGTFDNTAGKLSHARAYFAYVYPSTPFTTSGPGTLAEVTFNVIGYGSSDIQVVKEDTKLIGYFGIPYEIIDGPYDEDHLGHGFFRNKYAGDIDGDHDVDYDDFIAFAASYLKTSGMPGYNREADFDFDGDVDYDDFLAFAANYLKTFP